MLLYLFLMIQDGCDAPYGFVIFNMLYLIFFFYVIYVIQDGCDAPPGFCYIFSKLT